MTSLICRRAGVDDMDFLIRLTAEFHEKSPLSPFPFSPVGTRRQFEFMIIDPRSVVIIHEAGMICGSVSYYPFCELKTAKEALWFARSGGMVLLSAFQNWAREIGADAVLLSTISGGKIDPKILNRALRIQGYKTVETSLIRTF